MDAAVRQAKETASLVVGRHFVRSSSSAFAAGCAATCVMPSTPCENRTCPEMMPIHTAFPFFFLEIGIPGTRNAKGVIM